MDKSDFQEHTKYVITRKDEEGKLRPESIYVFKNHDDFMVVRRTTGDGKMLKLQYDDVVRIVKTQSVAEKDYFYVPDAVLDAKTWADRTSMERYSSASHMGK